MTDWTGVFPAVTTRFSADLALDPEAMGRHCAWLVARGVDGLILAGSLGEASVLEAEEKLELIRIARGAVGGRVPVLATVAESTTARACRFAEAARGEGADGLMVLPGMRYVAEEREAVAHFKAVAAAADLPVMIYNNPVAYGTDLGVAGLGELAADPRFVAIKESSDDVRRVTSLRASFGARFRIFAGVDNLALESLLMGADGWVAGLVDAFPDETVALYRLARAGRLEEARALYRWFRPLLDLDVSTKLVQNIKLVGALVGTANEQVRPPRLPLEGAERAHVEAVVRAALATRPALPESAA
jgi:4-hydroxy-tetrahydrodipicolinate synthase